MSFNNIKTKAQGFTIVELLIVVVVIAILAAITIVSYNGITARANTSAAQSMASSVIKKSELYNTDDTTTTAGYPASITALNNSSKPWNLTGVSSVASGSLNATNGKNSIVFNICGTGASNTAPTASSELTAATGSITGILVHYYDFSNSRVTTTSTTPASLSTGQVSGTVGTKNIACFQV